MDVKEIVRKAADADSFKEMMREEGVELNPEQAKEMFDYYSDGRMLSEEELNAVSGGHDRDYATEGCAATVEYGSSCWGTDGGCTLVNIDYDHMPESTSCPVCGKQTVYMSHEGVNVFYHKCRNCGAEFFEIMGSPWHRIH